MIRRFFTFAGARPLLLLASLAATGAAAQAMTVVPPTFEELVAESGHIVRAEVVTVEPFKVTSPDGHEFIKTRVVWKILRALKGDSTQTLSLEFLGGRVGTDALHVPGMPAFAAGDEDFLFIEPDTRVICPLIAAGHGRYRVQRAGAGHREIVMRDNRSPLLSLSEVSASLATMPAAAARARISEALTPEAFEAGILSVLSRTGGSDAK